MISAKNMPFEKRAAFMKDSLNPFPISSEFTAILKEFTFDIADGLKTLHGLLKTIYSATDSVEGKSDDQKFDELVATLAFSYAVFAFGKLVNEYNQQTVLTEKSILKQKYKKNGFVKRSRHLEHLGFSLQYLSNQNELTSLTRASKLSLV